MNDELSTLLKERRERAEPVPAPHDLIGAARDGARRRGRRRTTTAAAVGASVLVGAIAVGTLTLTSSPADTPRTAPIRPGGSGAPPDPTPTPTPTATPTATDPAPRSTTLVLAPAAPTAAPLSLGFLPRGWAYNASRPGYTDYRSTADDGTGAVIRVLAERRNPDPVGAPPRENARPVLGIPTVVQHYVGTCVPDYPCDPQAPTGATRVVQQFGDVSGGSRNHPVDVVYVVPDGVGLTRAQILRMISGTDVRDLTHPIN